MKIFSTKLDGINEFNNFETSMIQLIERKVRGLK